MYMGVKITRVISMRLTVILNCFLENKNVANRFVNSFYLHYHHTGASHKIRISTKRSVKYGMDALGASKSYCTYFGLQAT